MNFMDDIIDLILFLNLRKVILYYFTVMYFFSCYFMYFKTALMLVARMAVATSPVQLMK